MSICVNLHSENRDALGCTRMQDNFEDAHSRSIFSDHVKYAQIGLSLASLISLEDNSSFKKVFRQYEKIAYLNLSGCFRREIQSSILVRKSWVTDDILCRLLVKTRDVEYINVKGHELSDKILPNLEALPHLKAVAGFVPGSKTSDLLLGVQFYSDVPQDWEPQRQDGCMTCVTF
jgi:hypothetical protein